LRLQVLAEKARAEQRMASRELQNLKLRIRDDDIEVNGLGVRVNQAMLAAEEILGARFGRCVDLGKPSGRAAFQIDLAASHSRRVQIDCRRIMRGKGRAAGDFAKLTRALRTHIASQVAGRIASAIRAPASYLISETDPALFAEELAPDALAMIGAMGFVAHRDPLHPSEIVRIPLDGLRHKVQGDALIIHSAGSESPIAQWHLSKVWNAVFFAEILEAIRKLPAVR
jgi:hypothetical protein